MSSGGDNPAATTPARQDIANVAEESRPTRRAVVRGGAKLAFTAPLLSTFFASQAYANNYSCYEQGHKCQDPGPNWEPCCDTLTCKADGGSPTGFSCLP